jgi:hypothetical protein
MDFKVASMYDFENISHRRPNRNSVLSSSELAKQKLGIVFFLLLIVIFCLSVLLGSYLFSKKTTKNSEPIDEVFIDIPVTISTYPQGFNPQEHSVDNKLLNQHLFLNSVRPMLKSNGGFITAFGQTTSAEVVNTISDLSFLRNYVLRSRPLIIKGAAWNFPAFSKWRDDSYILRTTGDLEVPVETSKTTRFTGNSKETMKMSTFLSMYANPIREWNYYLSEMNLLNLGDLVKDVPEKPSLMSSEFYVSHVAQLWMGSGGQISSLRRDQYENMFCQITGSKHVKMYDPFQIDLLDDGTQVDAEQPDLDKYPLFKYALAVEAHLNEGDCLYIPSNWIHLSKSGSGRNLAVNWWFQPISEVGLIAWNIVAMQNGEVNFKREH